MGYRKKSKGVDLHSGRKKRKFSFVLLVVVMIPVVLIGAVYFYGCDYYCSHFYPGTNVLAEDWNLEISGKTAENVEKRIVSSLSDYSLTIRGNGNDKSVISAEDIGLHYETADALQNSLEEQNQYLWPYILMTRDWNRTIQLTKTYNKDILSDLIDSLDYVTAQAVEPRDAEYHYEDGEYVVTEAVSASQANRDLVYNDVKDAIEAGVEEISVSDYYEEAPENDNIDGMYQVAEAANKILASDITISTAYHTAHLDADTINDFLKIDEDDWTVEIDRDAVYDWVTANVSGPNYTVGKERKIKTPSSGTITVSGGTYGIWVNVSDETDQIMGELAEGTTIEREPNYRSSEVSSKNGGVGDTYIDVSIADQKVWLIKDGEIDYSTDCVTGLTNGERNTPTGTYYISWKTTDWTMVKYETFVNYWMPIDDSEGIGLHDATWRSKFGGNIYKTDGSHGCINLPYDAAKYIYNNTDVGVPVIVH